MANRDELLEIIGIEIINSRKIACFDWKFVSIVVEISEGLTSNSGFAYLNKDSIKPVTVSSIVFNNAVRELREEIKILGQKQFSQMLIQLRSSDNKMRVDFEYDNPSRWAITPKNLAKIRESLRPSFST